MDLCATRLADDGAAVLARVCAGTFVDPDDGRPIAALAVQVTIARGVVGRSRELVGALGFGRRLAVVSDRTTHALAGAAIERALAGAAAVTPIVLEADVTADLATAERLRDACAGVDALVAVGSGTVNDLCKHAAAALGRPYAVFGTAPSMNGYTSTNAAITVDGHKLSLPATLARGVFLDLDILAAAPARMIRAGLGDSLCRSTAEVDWRLSHHLLGTPFRSVPFAMLAPDEALLLDDPASLLARDPQAMEALARTLVLSGLGMTLCGGSQPASQGEHLVSHYVDMFAPASRAAYFHGEQVAVATLALARLQARMLDAPAPRLRACAVDRAALESRFGTQVGDSCWDAFAPKALTPARAEALSARLAAHWDAWRETLAAAAIGPARLDAAMAKAGVPRTPAAIGVDDAFFEDALRNARFLRDRYTFLDLADDAGRLDARALH
jgi:glycerol-1-phosphate dehydrogenase [NAD(P)+]